MKNIYLDSAATTKVDEKVVEAMLPYFSEKYANPSSSHRKGQEAKQALNRARHAIARTLGAKDDEIIFTSGGTEANNLAIKGIAFANKNKGNHIITTKIEHDSVLKVCKWLETQSFEITYLDVDSEGFVNPEELEKAITSKTILVSVIHGNNEIGTIQNLEELGKLCKNHEIHFHTDACQSYTKTALNVKKQNLDLATINSHKINGPKGVGALYIKKGVRITSLLHGGGHEFGFRAGTENLAAIVGFAEAAKIAMSRKISNKVTKLRDKLIQEVLKIPDTKLNGPAGEKRLAHNANFSFKYIEGESIGAYLDAYGIASSTGSACSNLDLKTSHVLTAIGLKPEDINSSLRLTLSRFTIEEDINRVVEVLPKIVKKLRKMSPLVEKIKKI